MSTYRHANAPARINASFDLTQLHNISVSLGANKNVIVPGGGLDVGAVMLSSAQPMVSFATRDLSTLCTQVSLTTGLRCSSGATFYWRRRAIGGTFLGNSSHQKVDSTDGFLMVNGISASQDGPADANATYYPFSSDGVSQPLAYTDSVTPAASSAFVSEYYLGPVYLNGTQLNGVTSVGYDNGMAFRYHQQDGSVYPRNGSIYARQPMLSISLHSVQELSKFSPHMALDSGTNLTAYFIKGSSGGTRAALDGTNHISLNFATAAWGVVDVPGSNSDDVSVNIQAHCISTVTYSGSVAIGS